MAKKKQETTADMSGLFQDVLDILEGKGSEVPKAGEAVDMDALIGEMEESLKRISDQAEALYSKTGMTKEEIEEFSTNSDNFSKEEWAVLSRIREKVDEFQEEALNYAEEGEAILRDDEKFQETFGKKKGKSTGAKKRVKKKDWMQT